MISSRAALPLLIAALLLLSAGLPAGPSAAAGAAPKLPQNMKLDPAIAARQPPRVALPTTERLDAAYATLKEKFTLTKTALEARRRATDECLARAYTTTDQQEAGCRPEDSVQTCGEKLLCRCRREASREYSRRLSEFEIADRALHDEIRRLAQTVQRENVDVTANYRCIN